MTALLYNDVGGFFQGFWENTGFAQFFVDGGWKNLIMIAVALLLLYLAIFRKAEPYLLIPMGVGMLLANLPLSHIMDPIYATDSSGNLWIQHVEYKGLLGVFYPNGEDVKQIIGYEGLLGVLYKGIQYEIYPCSGRFDWHYRGSRWPHGHFNDH